MIKQLSAAVVALFLCTGFAHAAGDCDAQAADKKLAGAAKTSFLKKCNADGAAASPAAAACDKQAADKKLAGAAKNSFVKKCVADAGGAPAAAAAAAAATAAVPAKADPAAACDKQAADKKLAGAAKNSFVKKCVADAKA